jgi:hypothetical protein
MEHIAHDETSFVRPAEVGEMELYHAKTWLGKYVFSQDAKTIAIQYAATAIAAVSPAMTAPAPIEMRSAGRAQQRSVEALPKSAKDGAMLSRQSPLTKRRPAPYHHDARQRFGSPLERQDRQWFGRSSKHPGLRRG